ncbi:hypothetical protein Leryth_025005 [Lithospermum erythrorhizon]|nr:hypothetical protein Leryth_025005 [Lithospermum erythrorhizon]
MGSVEENGSFLIDEAYEFLAPKFYDFINGETELDMKNAELWFDNNSSYPPSPFMPRIKASRTVQIETLCDFTEAEHLQKETDPSEVTIKSNNAAESIGKTENEIRLCDRTQIDPSASDPKMEQQSDVKEKEHVNTLSNPNLVSNEKVQSVEGVSGTDVCTPVPMTNSKKGERQTASRKNPNSKKATCLLRNSSGLKLKPQSKESSQVKSSKAAGVIRNTNVNNVSSTTKFAQENQAIKRQKLEGGNARQILNIKPRNLPHKTRLGLVNDTPKASITTVKAAKEDRKLYVREPSRQFVSAAEMILKFQSSTRDMSLQGATNSVQHKSKLKLTRPKEPEFETSQRARPTRIKSSAELEEEMMAKMPKFKARPVNKKILETPSLQAPMRSTPQLPEFKEFHLETMSRANHNLETATVASTESAAQSRQCMPHHLTTPKPPVLQTSLRARPPMAKSFEELEKEQLEKFPKFKAKPLNKKIFESKGGLGIFCNLKRQVTVPEEFHFALDERIPPPPTNVADLFDKLSLNSEAHHGKDIPRVTNPNPFNLYTEGRGVEKERRRAMEILLKQMEEERARVPKATPYPYTTDFPVIPPKPEPKPCTKPEPFQLESLVRHEEEMQREMEERQRMEMEEAQRRLFRAQPILKEDPIPLPERERLPLTQVQEFDLHVEHRAVDRADFDKKIKEKELMYKRYLEEAESARMMEEEKALKQLRKTLVPHARPVPKFHQPFLPQRSTKEVTRAKSPKLHVVRRQERRKMYSPLAAPTSSSASNMR